MTPRKLRWARNEIKHFERRLAEKPEREPILRARYERAVAILVEQRLTETNAQSQVWLNTSDNRFYILLETPKGKHWVRSVPF